MEPSVDIEAIIIDPAASFDVTALLVIAREFSAYPEHDRAPVVGTGEVSHAAGAGDFFVFSHRSTDRL